MFSRRTFLRQTIRNAPLVALAPAVPGFLARTAHAVDPMPDGRVLVVIQLDGGNDGVNTVVPFKDEGYARQRKQLRIPAESLVKISDEIGFHPALKEFRRLLEEHRLTIVQGVGYPNPNRSHFESMAIWHSARLSPDRRDGNLGWIGRGLDGDARAVPGIPSGLFIGAGTVPVALQGRRCVASALSRPDDFVLPKGIANRRSASQSDSANDLLAFVRRNYLDGYATAEGVAQAVSAKERTARYPDTALGGQLRTVAQLLKAGLGTRVYYVLQPGYDTHLSQLGKHAELLSELSGAVVAFLDDLKDSGLGERVAVLGFSEFGRAVKENGSLGTDHGTAGPVFLVGAGVRPGVVGAAPRLLDLDATHGELKVGIDFRRIYSTVLEEWLDVPASSALDGEFAKLPLIRT